IGVAGNTGRDHRPPEETRSRRRRLCVAGRSHSLEACTRALCQGNHAAFRLHDPAGCRRGGNVMKAAVTFYSEGSKLSGDLYLPPDLSRSDRRAGIVLCHGYTGVKDLYLPDNARVLNAAGYIVLTFDYKGWGMSEGPRSRLAPYSRVADVQAALTFLSLQPQVDPERLGIYGTSYGGAPLGLVCGLGQRGQCGGRGGGLGHRGRRVCGL